MNLFFWRKKQDTMVDEVMKYVNELFSDVSPEIRLAVGVPLGFYVVKKIIELKEKEPKKRNWFDKIKSWFLAKQRGAGN